MHTDPQSSWTLTSRWVFPVGQAPLEQGTVAIDGERIVAVEPHGVRKPDRDFGNSAILPGFVNTHTHLDLSGLRGKIHTPGEFTTWLKEVIHHRRVLTPDHVLRDIENGLHESTVHGTTLLGDIASGGLSWQALAHAPVRSVVFYELLGLPKTRAQAAWAGACDWLRSHPATEACRPGLSPHAPYSVRSSLYRAAANLARGRGIALATHLAETRAESELLRDHRGPFVDFLKDVGVWDAEGLVSGYQKVLDLNAASWVALAPGGDPSPPSPLPASGERGEKSHPLLLAHGNYLDASVPFPPNAIVVYCPRTHAAFGHEPYPLRQFLKAGVRVALGTDSLASNPDLSILEEARFVRDRFPDIGGDIVLAMATLWGAEALGCQTETGSLTDGKSADLVALPLSNDDCADPHELIFRSTMPVSDILCRGKWVLDSRNAVIS
jgi:cytosine/adenosine deaminase-related metal-dependent hydrolase